MKMRPWAVFLSVIGLWVPGGIALAQNNSKPGVEASAITMAKPARPLPVIFDTDIGNDCDDTLALAMLHSLASRGEVDLLAVTITKDNPKAAQYVSALNNFYGRPSIPIGVVKNGKTPAVGKFLPLVDKLENGKPLYPVPPSWGQGAPLPDAVTLLRQPWPRQKMVPCRWCRLASPPIWPACLKARQIQSAHCPVSIW